MTKFFGGDYDYDDPHHIRYNANVGKIFWGIMLFLFLVTVFSDFLGGK